MVSVWGLLDRTFIFPSYDDKQNWHWYRWDQGVTSKDKRQKTKLTNIFFNWNTNHQPATFFHLFFQSFSSSSQNKSLTTSWIWWSSDMRTNFLALCLQTFFKTRWVWLRHVSQQCPGRFFENSASAELGQTLRWPTCQWFTLTMRSPVCEEIGGFGPKCRVHLGWNKPHGFWLVFSAGFRSKNSWFGKTARWKREWFKWACRISGSRTQWSCPMFLGEKTKPMETKAIQIESPLLYITGIFVDPVDVLDLALDSVCWLIKWLMFEAFKGFVVQPYELRYLHYKKVGIVFARPPGGRFMQPSIDTILVCRGVADALRGMPVKRLIDVGSGSGCLPLKRFIAAPLCCNCWNFPKLLIHQASSESLQGIMLRAKAMWKWPWWISILWQAGTTTPTVSTLKPLAPRGAGLLGASKLKMLWPCWRRIVTLMLGAGEFLDQNSGVGSPPAWANGVFSPDKLR